jgi:hypothetical protein
VPYTNFRLIAYEVHTASAKVNVISGWSAGTECPAVARVPVPNTLPDDARIRLKRLASVVDLAKTQITAGGRTDNANTLKIFLVPEFYLRPPATIGADYKGSTYPVGVRAQILQALESMFVHADFADWLFVCGTMMWNTLAGDKTTKLFFNTAVIVRGGQANALHVVEKRIPSGIDGVPVAMLPGGGLRYAAPGLDPSVKLFFERWEERKRHVLTFDGITFGVEVCLDHRDDPQCKVLRKVVSDWYAKQVPPPLPGVQIHLLTAGGMGIELPSVSAKIGGYILRNDGLHQAAAPAGSEMRQVQGYNVTDPFGVATLPSDPTEPRAVARLGPRDPASNVPIPGGAPSVPAPPNPYPAIPQQRLRFYPLTAVP